MSSEELELNPVKMLMDAIRWNMLNVIRVELFFNCYRIWSIFVNSSLQSPRGQYAIVSLVITVLAQFAVQFNFGWLLTIYSIYLIMGMCVWLHRRVWFYHRKLDPEGVNETIQSFELAKSIATNHNKNGSSSSSGYSSNTGTLKPDKHGNNSSGSPTPDTNSLQRQRALAYRDFKSLLSEPRRNHKEYAMSIAHLSHASKLVADKDVFDEMHFQMLATRRDVVNIALRSILLVAATLLAYF